MQAPFQQQNGKQSSEDHHGPSQHLEDTSIPAQPAQCLHRGSSTYLQGQGGGGRLCLGSCTADATNLT